MSDVEGVAPAVIAAVASIAVVELGLVIVAWQRGWLQG